MTAGGIFIYHAVDVVLQNKERDTWTIYFQELEAHARNLQRRMNHLYAAIPKSSQTVFDGLVHERLKTPDALFALDLQRHTLSHIFGPLAPQLKLADIGLEKPLFVRKWTVLKTPQGLYAVRRLNREALAGSIPDTVLRAEHYLAFWRFDASESVAPIFLGQGKAPSSIYVLTMAGHLAFSSSKKIKPAKALLRPLVQHYVSASFRSGQLEYQAPGSGKAYFGFFLEVPDTNLVLFSETPKSAIFADVDSLTTKLVLVLLYVLIASLILTYLPVSLILRPLHTLAQVAQAIGHGNFNIKLPHLGFGELNALARSYETMLTNLQRRDQHIAFLAKEQQHKQALQQQLEVARNIQRTLMPTQTMPIESGLEVAARYVPAGEVAGDWYTYFYDPTTRESFIVLMDVSGHGAGSALLTGLAAGVWESFRLQNERSPERLAQLFNATLCARAQNNAHATYQIVHYSSTQERIKVVNMGHGFPFLYYRAAGKTEIRRLRLPSPVGGLDPDAKHAVTELPFESGMTLCLFTDGLTEFNGLPLKPLTPRDISRLLSDNVHLPANTQVNALFNLWRKRLGSSLSPDDLCLLVVKAL